MTSLIATLKLAQASVLLQLMRVVCKTTERLDCMIGNASKT